MSILSVLILSGQFDLTRRRPCAYSTSYDVLWNAFAINRVTKVALYYTNDSSAPSPAWNLITNLAPNTASTPGPYTFSPGGLNNTNKIPLPSLTPE